MVGKNNVTLHELQDHQTNQTYALRKLSVGVASVLVGTTLAMWSGETVHADTVVNNSNSQTGNAGAKPFDDSAVNSSENGLTNTDNSNANVGSTTIINNSSAADGTAESSVDSLNETGTNAAAVNNNAVVNSAASSTDGRAASDSLQAAPANEQVDVSNTPASGVNTNLNSAEPAVNSNVSSQASFKSKPLNANATPAENNNEIKSTFPSVNNQDANVVMTPVENTNSNGSNSSNTVPLSDSAVSYNLSRAVQQYTPQQLAGLFAASFAYMPGPVNLGDGVSSTEFMSTFTDALGNKWHYSVNATVHNSGNPADNYHSIRVMLQSVDISQQSRNADYLYIPGGHVEDPNTAGFMDNVFQAVNGALFVNPESLDANSYSWSVSPELVNYVANNIGHIKFGWLNAGDGPVSWKGVFSARPDGELDHVVQNKTLKSVDMSSLNLDNVTSLAFAFNGCVNLESVDFGNWRHVMTNLTNVKGMFNGDENLKEIKNLGNVHFDHVTDFSYMFLNSHRLNNIDLGTLRVFPESAEFAESMFSGSGDDVSGKFVVFNGPGSRGQNGIEFDFSKANLKNTKFMFDNTPFQWVSIKGKIPSESEGMFDGMGYHEGGWNGTVSLVDLRNAQIDNFGNFIGSQKFRSTTPFDYAGDGSKINEINPMLVLTPESMVNNQDYSRRMVLGALDIFKDYESSYSARIPLFTSTPGSFVSSKTASVYLVNNYNKWGVPIRANQNLSDVQSFTNFDSNLEYLMSKLLTSFPNEKLISIQFTTLGDGFYYIENPNVDLEKYFSSHTFVDALNDDSFDGGPSFEEFRQRYRNAFSGGYRDAGVYAMLENPEIRFYVKDKVLPRTLNIEYVDPAGHQVGTQSFTGMTGESKSYTLAFPKGYQKSASGTNTYDGASVSYSGDGRGGVINVDYSLDHSNPHAVIYIEPIYVNVDADHPHNNGTPIPDSDKTFHGVTNEDLNQTRTIRMAFNFGGHVVHGRMPVKVHRNAKVNAVTGEVSYEPWAFVKDGFPQDIVSAPNFIMEMEKPGGVLVVHYDLSSDFANGDYLFPVIPGHIGGYPHSSVLRISSLGITPDNAESREWVVNLQPRKIEKKIKFVDDQTGNVVGETSASTEIGQTLRFDATGVLKGNLKGYTFDKKSGLLLFNWNEIDKYEQNDILNRNEIDNSYFRFSGIAHPVDDYNQLAETGIISDRISNIDTDNNHLILTIVPNSTSPEIVIKVHHTIVPITRNVQVNWSLKFKNASDVPAEYRGGVRAEVVNADGSTTPMGPIVNTPTQVINGTVHGMEDQVTGEIKWDQRIDFSKSPLKAFKVRSSMGSVVYDDYSDTTTVHFYTHQNQSSSEYASIQVDNGGFSTDFVPADELLYFDWINNQMSLIAKDATHNEFVQPRIDLTTYLTFHKYEMNMTINYRYKGENLYTQTLVGKMDTKFANPYKAPKGFIIKSGQSLPMNFNLTDYAWKSIDVDLDLDRQINFRYVDYNNLNNSPMRINKRNADMSDLGWNDWKDHDLGNKSQLFSYIDGIGVDGQSNYGSQQADLQKLKRLGYDVYGEQSPLTYAIDNVTTSPDEYKQRIDDTYDNKFVKALQTALHRWHEQTDPIKNKINEISTKRQEQVDIIIRDDRKFATLDPASEALHKIHDEVWVAHNKINDYDEQIRILNNQLSQINFDDFLAQEVKPLKVVVGVGHLYDVYSADNTPKMGDKTRSGRTIDDVVKINSDAAKLTSVNSYGTYHTRHIEVNIVPGPTGLTWPLAVNEGPVEAYQNKTYGYFTTDDMSNNSDFEPLRMSRKDHYQYDVTLGHGWIYTLDNATGQVMAEEMNAEDASNFTMYIPTVAGYDLYVNDQKVNGNYFKLDQTVYGQSSSRLVYNVKYVPHSTTVVINVVDQHGQVVNTVVKSAYIDSTLNIGENFGQNFANDYNMQHPDKYMEVDSDGVPAQFSATPDQEGKVTTYTVNTHVYPLQNVEQSGDQVLRTIVFMRRDGTAGHPAVSDMVNLRVFKRTYTNDQGEQVELPNVNGDDEYVYQPEGSFEDAHGEIFKQIGTNNYQIVSGLQWAKAYTPYSKADTGVITVVY